MSTPKYIFVSGGVMSSLGKGITAASISLILERSGYKVCPVKCENNLNVDFGTLNPIEHGDPFLCYDGLEADLDLGNYERFLGHKMGYRNFMTMGQLYKTVIDRERSMGYDGEDVEAIPHVTDEIISRIRKAGKESKADIVVIELGGTVGEYQNNNELYYEASRVMGITDDVLHVHVTYVPVPVHIGEPKTKPAQIGMRSLMSMGLQIDVVVVRSEIPLDEHRKYKFGLKFGMSKEEIFSNENLSTIYEVPMHLEKQGIGNVLLKKLGLRRKKKTELNDWKKLVEVIKDKKAKKVKIGIVGKYFGTGDSQMVDSYYALFEAINHACWKWEVKPEFVNINSDKDESKISEKLKGVDGIIVPIGWGERGAKGKIKAIEYARNKKVPYLGLCFGMQLACVEYAQNVIGWQDANTSEINPKTKHAIIHSIPFDPKYQVIKGKGTSMRLGTFPCIVKKDSLVYKLYKKYNGFDDIKKLEASERHRHRFEFNNEYRDEIEKAGLVISGTSPDNFFVEMIELPEKVHPFFIATQGHPEYKSTPLNPHPAFLGFIKAAMGEKAY